MQEIFFCCLSFLILYIDRNVISKQRHTFFSSFTICMFFISFSYLIALVKISSTVLKRSRKKEHSCLLFDLSEKTSSTSPLSIMLTIDFLCRFFFFLTKLGSFPLFLSYWEISSWVQDLAKCFFHIYWYDHGINL